MPADVGQTDGGHNTHQQPVHEPQAKHPGPQGKAHGIQRRWVIAVRYYFIISLC